ncbi:MAG: hypothetical protein NZM42_06285 [Gemmatales bacterium]|nr:hypothetical protein [Gemmatales bacterium]MDW8221813.1 hypothetical protein [Gemmatales bacterium]
MAAVLIAVSPTEGWGHHVGVVQRSVLVQSGPGTIPPYYATARLDPGQTVMIVAEVGEFYAIQPPAGSFSYVPMRGVRMVPGQTQAGLVQEPVTTLIGSLLCREATIEGTRLAPGTLVRILGQDRIQVGEQTLDVYRIEPIGERRYVPKSAVAVHPATASSPAPSSVGLTVGGSEAVTALQQQAQMAYERGCVSGDFTEAKRLYQELAQSSEEQLRWEALNRLEFIRLRERDWANRPRTATEARPAGYAPSAGQGRQSGWPPSSPPAASAPEAAGVSSPSWANYRMVGVLRRSSYSEHGQPLYFLEDHRGQLRSYIRVRDVSSADRLLNRAVEIVGHNLGFRGELRAELIFATSLRALE